jgi:hypothetical protein
MRCLCLTSCGIAPSAPFLGRQTLADVSISSVLPTTFRDASASFRLGGTQVVHAGSSRRSACTTDRLTCCNQGRRLVTAKDSNLEPRD